MLRTIGFVMALAIAAPAAHAQMFDDLSEADRAALHAEIRSYLMQNPGILEEMVALLRQTQEAEEAERDRQLLSDNRDALENDGISPPLGNPEGDVTIVEFIDYQCSYCKRAHPEVAELLNTDGNIRLIRKEFPILGPASQAASKAALAVLLNEGKDSYSAFSDALMGFDGPLNAATINGIARKAGVDVATMQVTAEGPEVADILQRNLALAQSLQLSGTPSFVFGDQIVRGYVPLAEMVRMVDEIRGGT